MGEKLDELEIRLAVARIVVPPYSRLNQFGNVENVDGYTYQRSFNTSVLPSMSLYGQSAPANREAEALIRAAAKDSDVQSKVVTAFKALPGMIKTSISLLRDKNDKPGMSKIPFRTKAKLAAAVAVAANPLDDILGPPGMLVGPAAMAVGLAWVAHDIGLERLHMEWAGTPEGWALIVASIAAMSHLREKFDSFRGKPDSVEMSSRAIESLIVKLALSREST